MNAHSISHSEAAALLAPFVNARFAKGPRTEAVDILWSADCIDASVRGVSDEGISYFFYQGCELIPWDTVRQITIRQIDEFGNTLAAIVYRVVADAEMRRAA
ncbi:hypothetical protein [Novosphingobium colocasiae]|uniref:hypothetical protein n=1 Tax=Novosphingobium colocasiae TaxID=1256513 RepID=UPI0035B03B56